LQNTCFQLKIKMKLEIIKTGLLKSNKVFDFNKLRENELSDFEIEEYQKIFGKIVSENHNISKYFFSDLLNREDGTTHFLDKIIKFIECLKLINEENESFIIFNIDPIIYSSLLNYCQLNHIKVRKTFINLVFLINFKMKILFILKFIRMYFINCIILLFSKILLKNNLDKNDSVCFISYFDYRSVASNKYNDPFFSQLQDHLKRINSNYNVVVIMMYPDLYTGLMYIYNIYKTKQKGLITFFNLVKPFELTKVYFQSLKFRIKIENEVLFLNYPIKYLLNKYLEKEFYSTSKQFSVERSLIANILKYKNINLIIYPFENFSWEKYLCYLKNNNKFTVKLLGFQHTSFSLKLMHHFPSSFEKDLNIYPDKLLTTGKITKKLLENKGFFPENLIEVGCALRHEYLYKYLNEFNHENKIFYRIAFAFSFDIKRYNFIINNIIKQFGNREITVVLKYHPLNKNYKFNSKKLPENILISTDDTWETIMKTIDIILYEGNSICVDSLSKNIPAIYYPFTGNLYNTNQLYEYNWDYNLNLEDFDTFYKNLYMLIELNLKSDLNFFNYNKSYVKNYFQAITQPSLNLFFNVNK